MPYRRSSRSRSTRRRRSVSRSTRRRTFSRARSRSTFKSRSRSRRFSRKVGTPSFSIQTGRLPFARGGFYRFPYSDSFAISADGNTGTSVIQSYYTLNGPHDPLVNIGGQQPIQWDQVRVMYQKYIVHKADVTVVFNNPLYDGLLVGFRVRSVNNTVPTSGRTLADIGEMDNTRSLWINNTGSQSRTFKFSVNPWNVAGLTRDQYLNDRQDYQAATNVNPSWICYLEPFALHSVAGETNVVRCTVRIVYHVQFMEGITVLDI